MIDKFGECPSCNKNWNKGDIKTILSSMSTFKHKTEKSIEKIAAAYGWTEEVPTNFTLLSLTALEDGRVFGTCPNIRCQHIFNIETEQEYENLDDAINSEREIIENNINKN